MHLHPMASMEEHASGPVLASRAVAAIALGPIMSFRYDSAPLAKASGVGVEVLGRPQHTRPWKGHSMNLRLLVAVMVMLAASPLMAQQAGRKPLTTLRDKASYSFGMTMGDTLRKQGVEIDVDLMIQGIRDAAAGKSMLSQEDAMAAMQAFEKEMIAKEAAKSQRFLADNQRRPGVKTTKSGLQYKVIQQGQGPRPKANDVVRVNYKAAFINGTEFERSGEKPFTTPVDAVITGWQEALQMMPVGSKYLLFVPPELAYGAEGSPPAIGPNTALVFELELLEIAKPPAGASRQPVQRQQQPVR